MNILMVCYYYPPISDVGAKRSEAFSKYLAKHGWHPYVLSVRNPDKAYCRVGSDTAPPGAVVDYTYSIANPYKLLGKMNGALSRLLKLVRFNIERNYFYDVFCVPDHFFGWIPLAIIKGLSIINKHKIDMIYVSCSPFSSAAIGVILKQITGKQLIVDFRDPFTFGDRSRETIPRFRKIIDEYYEATVLRKCDLFIVTTDEINIDYQDEYPFLKNKIHTVHNGFDSIWLGEEKTNERYAKFSIFYGGNLYLDQDLFLDQGRFSSFLEALVLLRRENKINPNSFQFLYNGGEHHMVKSMARKYGLEELVVAQDNVSFRDNLSMISKSHLQLLKILKPMISTKLFEGIALNIPFLAIIPPGEVEDIIRRYSPSSYIIKDDSAEAIAEAIQDAKQKYESSSIMSNRVAEFLEKFSRENLTLKLIKIIEENLNGRVA
jgi:glycosyltransferase involved in cell wall biosynthesis